MTDEYSAATPSVCPFCETADEFESLTHDNRDNGDLEFIWECPTCGNQFTTIKQLDNSLESNHTLMWTENEDGEVNQLIHIFAGEDDISVEAKRAEFNMLSWDNYEVHGREWAIKQLREVFTECYDLPERETGELEIAWLPNNKANN